MNSEASAHKSGRDLTTGSIPRHLIVFSLPVLAGSLIQTGYSIVNAMWVGRGLGTVDMAAITDGFPIIFVLMAVALGLTMGSNILVSQSYGAKDWAQLKRTVQNSVVLVGIATVVCVVAGEKFGGDLLRLMGMEPAVLQLATNYLHVFLLGMPAMFGMFLIASLLRGTGDSKTPLYFQAISLAITAVLDPLLMFGWLGLPRLGLNGTAYATIVSSTAALIALVTYLKRKNSLVAPDWRHLRVDWPTSRLILKIGGPSMLQQSLISIGMFAIMVFVNAFGEKVTAAYGAASRIDQIAFLPAMNIGMAVSTLSGQNIGARLFHRVHEVFWWGLALCGSMTLMASLLCVGVPALLLSPFSKDPQVINIGIHYLRIMGFGYILLAVMFVSNGVVNGAGHTLITTTISLIGLWAFRIPLAAYLSRSMHRPEGIWYAMVISFGIGMTLSLTYYASGRWKKSITGHARAPLPMGADPDVGEVLTEGSQEFE